MMRRARGMVRWATGQIQWVRSAFSSTLSAYLLHFFNSHSRGLENYFSVVFTVVDSRAFGLPAKQHAKNQVIRSIDR